MQRICVTGPESTGKTTLVQQLAEALGTEWVPEASREYAERVSRELTVDDVLPIAREHIALADSAARRLTANGTGVLVLDTDLISTIVYGAHYYGLTSAWLEAESRARLADLYLLCDIDVPWIPDGMRDRPENRDELFALFRDALAERGARVVTIRGDWTERTDAARRAVAGLRQAP